jgi:hypothetical protein
MSYIGFHVISVQNVIADCWDSRTKVGDVFVILDLHLITRALPLGQQSFLGA